MTSDLLVAAATVVVAGDEVEVTDGVGQAELGVFVAVILDVADEFAELFEYLGRVDVVTHTGELLAEQRFDPDDLTDEEALPAFPVSASIHQERMTRDEPHRGGHFPRVEREMVRDLQRRIVPDRPAREPGTQAEIDVFVIEEESLVEAVEFLETIAADQEATTRDPRHLLALVRVVMLALPPGARQ